MPALKGTKTEKHLKDAFAGESQAMPMSPRYSAQRPRVKPATRTDTSSTWSNAAIPPPACRSEQPPTT